MSVPIHISLDGQDQGTFSVQELATLWEAGDLGPEALYWHRGLTEWRLVSGFQPPPQNVGRTVEGLIRLVTTASLTDAEIERELELVSAECVQGVSLVDDFFAAVRDMTGGRSETLERVVATARTICLAELRKRAHAVDADAVVDVSFAVSEISGKGVLMVMMIASGTAVRLRDQPPPLPPL